MLVYTVTRIDCPTDDRDVVPFSHVFKDFETMITCINEDIQLNTEDLLNREKFLTQQLMKLLPGDVVYVDLEDECDCHYVVVKAEVI